MGYNPDISSMKVTAGRDSNYRSNDIKSRPTGNLKSSKDFKKVLQKASDEEQSEDEELTIKEITEEDDGTDIAMQEDDKKKTPPSLFDLTSGKVALSSDTSRSTLNAESSRHIDSPSEMYSKLTLESRKNAKDSFSETAANQDKYTTRFATEQTDLSSVNPLAALTNAQPNISLNANAEKTTLPVSNVQAIINQMVAKVTEMKNAGSTETVITLKNPPLFEGATIVLTGFDSAKNEFNVSIENLTQAAKQLLDQQSNKDSLILALEKKGYAVHILTATTLVENRLVDSLPQKEQSGNPRDEQQEQKRQQRQGGRQA